jgi:hypothetical protein
LIFLTKNKDKYFERQYLVVALMLLRRPEKAGARPALISDF